MYALYLLAFTVRERGRAALTREMTVLSRTWHAAKVEWIFCVCRRDAHLSFTVVCPVTVHTHKHQVLILGSYKIYSTYTVAALASVPLAKARVPEALARAVTVYKIK